MLSLQKWLRVNFIAAQMHATCAGFSYSTRNFHHKNAKRNQTEWLTVVFVYKHQHAHTRTYLTLSLLHVSIFNLARILKWQINLHGCCWGTATFASFLLILLSPKFTSLKFLGFTQKVLRCMRVAFGNHFRVVNLSLNFNVCGLLFLVRIFCHQLRVNTKVFLNINDQTLTKWQQWNQF